MPKISGKPFVSRSSGPQTRWGRSQRSPDPPAGGQVGTVLQSDAFRPSVRLSVPYVRIGINPERNVLESSNLVKVYFPAGMCARPNCPRRHRDRDPLFRGQDRDVNRSRDRAHDLR